ncbi:MAG: ATP-binding protein [Thermoanaerobaculia bacterium]
MKRGWRAVAAVAFAIFLCAALVLSFLSFQRKLESFTQADFNSRAFRGFLEVITPPDPQTEPALQSGDRIVLVDGQPVAALENPIRTLSRPPFPHKLAVVRGNEVAEASLGAPQTRVDLPYLFLAFVGILSLLIGLATLVRDRAATTYLFASFCVSTFAIYVLTPSGPVDGLWKAIWLSEDVFRAFAPALLLHFFLRFPTPVRRRVWAIYAAPLLYLAGEAIVSFSLLPIPGARLPFLVELLERFWLVYFAAYGSASVVRIALAARNGADASSQRQARWVALGTGFGLSPFILLYILPRLFGYSATWASCVGVVPLVFVPLGFSYAILKWRLWDVDVFAREAIATTVAVFLGAASFVLVNSLLNRVLTGFASGAKNFLAFGSGLFLASLLVPVKRRFSNAIERFQYGETYRARRALLDFSREWRGVREADVLADALASSVGEALKISPCRFFLLDRPLPPGLSREALVERLTGEDGLRIRSATFPSGEDLTFLRLFEDGFRYVFALKSGGRIAGALAVGLKEGRVPLSTEDRALLTTVLSQASLAFENAELYRTLERRMEEIRTLQEFQQEVIRSSSAGIVVCSQDGRLVSANPAFEGLAGRAESDLVGRPLAELFPGTPEFADAAAEQAFETRAPGADGAERIYRVAISPLRGSASSRVVLFDDISERVALEKGVSERERLASLGVLAAGVAHEVNTPLAGISSYAQMLLADTDRDDPRYDILKKMERQTFRASRLVGNLLEFARGRHGAHEEIDLSRVLSDAIESSEPALAPRQIRVEARGLERPWPSLGNARELEQVFVNLLINARDASPDGAPISLSIEENGGGCVVEVADRGKGLSEEEARRAFEPFFTTRQSGGTGLGLAIAREIVERHGGRILLQPRPGGGAVARVSLPG